MLLRPFLNDASSCASYLFGCGTQAKLAVVDPHADLVDDYLLAAAALGFPIVAVFETHVQADHLRSEEHTSELQSRFDLVCRLLLEKKKRILAPILLLHLLSLMLESVLVLMLRLLVWLTP